MLAPLMFVAGVGAALIFYAGFQMYKCTIPRRKWMLVKAKILNLDLQEVTVYSRFRYVMWQPKIEFEYLWREQRRRGGQFCLDQGSFQYLNKAAAALAIKGLVPGNMVDVYVNWQGDAVLHSGVSRDGMSHYLAIGCSGLLILAVVGWLAILLH